MTIVTENARLELLRCMAMVEDMFAKLRAKDVEEGCPGATPEFTPLFEGEWDNDADDIILALEESVKLGHMEAHALHATTDRINLIIASLRGGREWMVRITPAGYNWIRAHDAIGEAQQESSRVR